MSCTSKAIIWYSETRLFFSLVLHASYELESIQMERKTLHAIRSNDKNKTEIYKEIKSGYPLILKDAIQNLNDVREEGTIIKVVDEKNQFIGKGYYGKQNKGYGWILTRKESEQINQSFFESKIKSALHKRKQFYKSSDTTAFRVVNGEGDGLGA